MFKVNALKGYFVDAKRSFSSLRHPLTCTSILQTHQRSKRVSLVSHVSCAHSLRSVLVVHICQLLILVFGLILKMISFLIQVCFIAQLLRRALEYGVGARPLTSAPAR